MPHLSHTNAHSSPLECFTKSFMQTRRKRPSVQFGHKLLSWPDFTATTIK
jgi:hypothetical protein